MNLRPGAARRRRSLTSPIFRTTSNSLARPGRPYAFRDGDTARQIVFSVRLTSATTRCVFNGSTWSAAHSADA